MLIDLHPAVRSDWIGRTVGGSIRTDVVRHLSVDAEHLLLCLLALEEREAWRTRLLDARASASDIDCTFVIRDSKRLRSRFRRHVLSQVAIRAAALDDERFDRQDFVSSSQGRCRIVDCLLFRRSLCAAAYYQGRK